MKHIDSSHRLPLGISYLRTIIQRSKSNREFMYRSFMLMLTFLAYVGFHMSRKPISIVKNSREFIDCNSRSDALILPKDSCKSWISEIDGLPESGAKTYLGFLDTVYLVTYAVAMFFSGFVAERSNLRNFLTIGMVCSGLLSILFGGTMYLGIHSLWFLLLLQILSGIFQSTGWPGVVTVVANWYGKGKKGLIMGIWNSHTSVGNILGSVIAGFYVNYNWGLSFIVPGALMCMIGVIIYLFLIPKPEDVDMEPNTFTTGNGGSSSKLLDSSSDTEGPSLSKDEAIGFCGALRIPGVMEFSLCLFFAKLVSYTFLYWLPNYISSVAHIDAKQSATMSTYFDFGGLIGGIFAGIVSDRSGMSASTCALMLTSALPTLYFYQDIVSTTCPLSQQNGIPIYDACFAVNFALLMLTGLLVNGPYALITTAVSAELGTHKSLKGSGRALATVTAIIDGTGSIGAALGPFMAGYLTGNGSWSSVFNMLIFSNIMALMLLVRLVKGELRRWHRRRYSV